LGPLGSIIRPVPGHAWSFFLQSCVLSDERNAHDTFNRLEAFTELEDCSRQNSQLGALTESSVLSAWLRRCHQPPKTSLKFRRLLMADMRPSIRSRKSSLLRSKSLVTLTTEIPRTCEGQLRIYSFRTASTDQTVSHLIFILDPLTVYPVVSVLCLAMSAKSTKSADSLPYGFSELLKLFEGTLFVDSVVHVVGAILTSCQVSSFDHPISLTDMLLQQFKTNQQEWNYLGVYVTGVMTDIHEATKNIGDFPSEGIKQDIERLRLCVPSFTKCLTLMSSSPGRLHPSKMRCRECIRGLLSWPDYKLRKTIRR
jgi:hypothetical protein